MHLQDSDSSHSPEYSYYNKKYQGLAGSQHVLVWIVIIVLVILALSFILQKCLGRSKSRESLQRANQANTRRNVNNLSEGESVHTINSSSTGRRIENGMIVDPNSPNSYANNSPNSAPSGHRLGSGTPPKEGAHREVFPNGFFKRELPSGFYKTYENNMYTDDDCEEEQRMGLLSSPSVSPKRGNNSLRQFENNNDSGNVQIKSLARQQILEMHNSDSDDSTNDTFRVEDAGVVQTSRY